MSSTSLTDDDVYDDLEDDGGLSGFWILVIFLIVLSIFAAIVYFAYQRGLDDRGMGEDLPTITADPTPVREEIDLAPAYDPRSEEVDEELNAAADTPRVVADVDPEGDPLEDYEEPATASDAAEAVGDRVAESVPDEGAGTPPVPNVAPNRPERVAEAEPEPSTPAASTPSSSGGPKAGAAGTYAVQAGAYGSDAEATGIYERLSGNIGSLVSNQPYEVNVATVKGTTYHRLWIGEFPTRDAAAAYCEKLSAAGQGCFVQKR